MLLQKKQRVLGQNSISTLGQNSIGANTGGGDSTGHPRSAKDWGPILEKNNFSKVNPENYVPKPGDTMVFQSTPGHEHGHIQAYDGPKWISDYTQNNTIPPSYKSAPYTIYRAPASE